MRKLRLRAVNCLAGISQRVAEAEFEWDLLTKGHGSEEKKFQNKRTIVGIGKDDCIGMEKTVPMTAVKLFQGEMKTNWN